ncbi:MAG: pyridoxamine 5'-phosphate oxidase family protein [Candidatus Limnocylindria bacterium]|nr:pyridoxamine 5'-phosphate oxidase family protein [Candidatus Limnocylindria bacterium]
MTAPRRDRPQLPQGYITTAPAGMLSWAAVQRLLVSAPYFWIATTGADGAPHLVQQWGVWIDQQLIFEGSDHTRWARNLARDPRIGFGMQNGNDAVYGDGKVDVIRDVPIALARRIARQYGTKYGRGFKYRPKPEQYAKGYVFRVRPAKLIAFDVKRFNTSATRFTFAD